MALAQMVAVTGEDNVFRGASAQLQEIDGPVQLLGGLR